MKIVVPNKRIGVGVSGGMDSMVLLNLLMEQKKDITVINIDHCIRGADSKSDSDFVEEFCNNNNILCLRFEVDVLSQCRLTRESVELCARNLRYEIFNRLLDEKKVDIIALAHHADDNIETVLMRIFRGTGIKGLKGILDSERFIHPLINYTKQDIENYATKNNIQYVTDSTNFESEYTRNYIRNEIIPTIKKKFEGAEKGILRLIDNAKETFDYIERNLIPIKKTDNALYFDIDNFQKSHSAIQKNGILKLFEELGVIKDIETRHLEYIISLAQKSNNACLDLPYGVTAVKEYDKLLFMKKSFDTFEPTLFDIEKEYIFDGERISFVLEDKIVKGRSFDPEKIPADAVIRKRQEGDIFKKCNGRTKKLSDYLTDIKMPKRLRDRLLVVASGKQVLIILGVEISDIVKVDKNTKNIYAIKKETI
ncbi:MAG: tRNA lysidine(34) synthetase TilS [Bacillota bacterium]|jgi:tRNA(Ile)-lysidine synthase|nr:tRNA lysidine(34) synthetase TilS [Bacillota bacterium]HHU43374.1 tRNA lysidine(34) synthetase TilS [Clostridiales bacterium]